MYGLLAFWIGGAGAAPVATQSAVRSLLAPWIGGAGATPVATQGGFQGLFAFWTGGGAALYVSPVTPAQDGGSGVGGGTSSWEHRAGWLEYTYEKQRRYDELYKKLLAAERALEQVQFETVTKTTVAQIAQERQYIKELKLKIAVLKQQLEELVAAAEEEHLMVVLLAW